MGRPRSIHERSSRCSLLAAPASMTARLYRSSRAQCLAFTVAQLNFRKDSLREALNIPVRHRDVTPRLPAPHQLLSSAIATLASKANSARIVKETPRFIWRVLSGWIVALSLNGSSRFTAVLDAHTR